MTTWSLLFSYNGVLPWESWAHGLSGLVLMRHCTVFSVLSCWQKKSHQCHDCQNDAAPLSKGITALLKIGWSELRQMLSGIYWIPYKYNARFLCILVVRKQVLVRKEQKCKWDNIIFCVLSWGNGMKSKRNIWLLKNNRIYCQENI